MMLSVCRKSSSRLVAASSARRALSSMVWQSAKRSVHVADSSAKSHGDGGLTYLVFGGAGLVGTQIVRNIVRTDALNASKLVIGSLHMEEAKDVIRKLKDEFADSGIEFTPVSGNVFVPSDMADTPRQDLVKKPENRQRMLEFIFGDFEAAARDSYMTKVIQEHRPHVIVDCMNTATGLSYQDVFTGTNKVMSSFESGRAKQKSGGDGVSLGESGVVDVETLLMSQAAPQLIRHVRLLLDATVEVGTRTYLKVGTTGTGGMGMNLCYTHSEDRPSNVLLAKNEAAFGHTGLLFLMARTPDAPIVKELKPAAMIGYKAVRMERVHDKNGNTQLFAPKDEKLGDDLQLVQSADDYEVAGLMELPIVQTGENGSFCLGEFGSITAGHQMEFLTPEEIARAATLELLGANTGHDVISAMDGAVMDPSYRAGQLRSTVMTDLKRLVEETSTPSIALGQLGPPLLGKVLYEMALLEARFRTFEGILYSDAGLTKLRTAEEISQMLDAFVTAEEAGNVLLRWSTSIGVPVLRPDGKSVWRGPNINIPQRHGHETSVGIASHSDVDTWADKGWVDLRPENMQRWLDRIRLIVDSRADLRHLGSQGAKLSSYFEEAIDVGSVAAWIMNNEMGGYRIK